jgi:hypothetical protein
MLFGIYLGSTGYVINNLLKFIKQTKEKLIDEGYMITEKELDKEEIKKVFIALAILLCPVLNIAFPFFISLWPNKCYEGLKKNLIKTGQIIDCDTFDRVITNRINRDPLLKLDNEIMKTLLMPEELEQIKLKQQRELNDTVEKPKEYIFSDYPIMNQTFENQETNIEPTGYTYKKLR